MSDKTKITPAALRALLNGDVENALLAMQPGGIERQEAMGQAAFVGSESLPLTFNYCTKEQFEKMGVIFGEPINDLFQQAILPSGWKKVATDHSMWSNLIDDKGRERASIFYKAAFYDRSAFIGITPRFSISRDWKCDSESISTHVTDSGKVIFVVPPVSRGDDWKRNSDIEREQYEAAKTWLVANFPNFADPTAYWEPIP